jgi:hypothetical protein
VWRQLVDEINRPNMGLTLDVGHCLMAGENPAQRCGLCLNPVPYTLHPTPTTYALHLAPYTLCHTPDIPPLHPTPELHSTPDTLHPKPAQTSTPTCAVCMETYSF